ncbi:MAG: hypothetical protein GKS05_09890 [Nitrospirales bacterium]|nr:hypothetical protein [Nitrospirales bacterium]
MQLGDNLAPRQAVDATEGHGLLFEYTLKCLLFAGFFELVLYRLVSRLGMHLSKLAEKSEAVRITLQSLSSLGFVLLNLTAILLFLFIFLLLAHKLKQTLYVGKLDAVVVPAVSMLVLLTVVYLVFPPAMLGSVIYNVIFMVVLCLLTIEFMLSHHVWSQRIMVGCFVLGISGWVYYQILSTGYGLLRILDAPPLVHEISRAGEALMVVASILVFWAYGGTSFFSKNKVQRHRAMTLLASGGVTFLALLFLDYFLSLFSAETAYEVRKAGEGIGWIFQMGMGYTFYLPFALYMAGLICWSYTVVKLVLIGRMAGFGLGLMFIAGYALQLSHLTLMVVVGMMLLNIDKRGILGKSKPRVDERVAFSHVTTAVGETS